MSGRKKKQAVKDCFDLFSVQNCQPKLLFFQISKFSVISVWVFKRC